MIRKLQFARFRRYLKGARFVPAVLLLAFFVAVAAEPLAAADPPLVAVGDVHGNYDGLVAILQQAKVLNRKLEWSGGRTTLIFTGDLLDRGPDSRKVLDLLMKLEKQASRKRGHVVVLLGNHEIMNLVGDLRYVSAEEYASFADEKSAARRARAFRRYAVFIRTSHREDSPDEPAAVLKLEQEWLAAHPEGFLEHREAYGPKGKYGKWIRQRPAMGKAGEHLFLHGGISPEISSLSLRQINARIWAEINAFDDVRKYLVRRGLALPFFTLSELTGAARRELNRSEAELAQKKEAAELEGIAFKPLKDDQRHIGTLKTFLGYPAWLSFHPDGPLWFRGYSNWDDAEGNEKIQPILEKYEVNHIVVGHTPQSGYRIRHRFGRRVSLIDTGMLNSYYRGGHPSVLRIRGSERSALYLEDSQGIRRAATASHGDSVSPAEYPVSEDPGAVIDAAGSPALPASARPIWFDPNGNRLPFESEEELLAFLKTAKVIQQRNIGVGITNPKKLLLEQDGVQMRAIFRDVNDEKRVAKLAGRRTEINFRDSYLFEVAAYELSKLLGLDTIPPAVLRKVSGKSGSVQVWIEDAMMEKDRVEQKLRPPDQARWARQMGTLRLFDALIQNTDRNLGNSLIDKNWKVWLIDHTRAFRLSAKLSKLNRILSCERTLWENLQALDKRTLRARLGKFLRNWEIDAILKRRDAIVAHLQARIDAAGEENIIYTLGGKEDKQESAEVRP